MSPIAPVPRFVFLALILDLDLSSVLVFCQKDLAFMVSSAPLLAGVLGLFLFSASS